MTLANIPCLESIAGKNAETRLSDISQSNPASAETSLEDREAALRALEQELRLRAKELQQWEDELKEMFDVGQRVKGEECTHQKTMAR